MKPQKFLAIEKVENGFLLIRGCDPEGPFETWIASTPREASLLVGEHCDALEPEVKAEEAMPEPFGPPSNMDMIKSFESKEPPF